MAFIATEASISYSIKRLLPFKTRLICPALALFVTVYTGPSFGIPVVPLLKGIVTGVTLVNDLIQSGETVRGWFRVNNSSQVRQDGVVILNIYSASDQSKPEASQVLKVSIPPGSNIRIPLPPMSPQSQGKKVLSIKTSSSTISTTFRYGSYCCDGRGRRRCPVPYVLDIGTECLCEGQGIGNICE